MKKNLFTDRELKNALRSAADGLYFEKKLDVKTAILSKAQAEQQPLVAALKILGKKITLGAQAKWLIKEILIARAGQDKKWRFAFDWSSILNSNWKRYGALATAFMFVFGLVLWPWQWTVDSALAANYAVLEQLAGDVKVNRNGVNLTGYMGMVLVEGDQIKSASSAKAELRFGNDNVVRLGENSKILLSKLTVVDEHYPVVNFELLDGESWVRVFNVPGSEAEFEVKVNDLVVSANNRVAFDVKLTPEFSRVVAIDNNLELVLSHHQQLIAATLQPEKMIKVRAKTPFVSYQEQIRFEGTVSNNDLDWFERNLISDRVYLDTLENRWKDLVADRGGITPESSLYSLKEFKRKARLALTIDELDREEVRLGIANEQFYEAQKVLAKGDSVGAKKLLKNYQDNIALVSKKANEIQIKDPARADALRKTIDASLLEQRQLLLPLEGNSIYAQTKTVVETTKVNADKASNALNPSDEEVDGLSAPDSEKINSSNVPQTTVLPSSLGELTVTDPVKPLETFNTTELPKLDVLIENVTSLKDVKEKTGTQDTITTQPVEETSTSVAPATTNAAPVQSGVVIEVAPKTTE